MKKIKILLLLTLGFFTACSQTESYSPESYKAGEAQNGDYTELEQTVNTDDISVTERKIIRTADYRIQVKNVDESTGNIEDLVKSYNGFISTMKLTSNSYETNNQIIIRVPNQHFNTLMKAVAEQAIFTNYKTINSTDVTEEFVDIETRLKTKKEVRDRYIDILKNKAKTVEEVLYAEEKIRIIQEEIEAKEGRLRFLKEQVSLSTITLDIYEKVSFRKIPDEYEKSFFESLIDNLVDGWMIVTNFILALAVIWPLLILFGLVFFFRKRILTKIKR